MFQVNPLLALEAVRHQLTAARMRLPVLLTGSAEDTLKCCLDWLVGRDLAVLWVSERAPEHAWRLPDQKSNHELGREADVVVLDLFSGLSVDTLAALAGVVRAGGWLLLLAPPRTDWPTFADPEYRRITVEPYGLTGVRRHFLQRAAHFWGQDERVVKLQVQQPAISHPPNLPVAKPLSIDEWGCASDQQRAVVTAILRMLEQSHPAPIAVQADRGRGKSAALGIAAQRARQTLDQIIVTAPRPEAAATLIRFANADGVENIRFVAPDALVQDAPPADLLLVDEAAALAPTLLREMLKLYRRVVFATTVQGYEGTGQGFLLRFSRYLNDQYPGWQLLRMSHPVRWADGDPLEAFVSDWLLLNACDEPAVTTDFVTAQLTLQELTSELALADESRLRAVHGLLVSAHYRTRPSDLRTLLDGPNIRTWYLHAEGQVIGVVMVAEEGQLPEALSQAILEGKRRPHGHVLAQSLAVHLNVAEALAARSWRIVRIAVHSHWQRRGMGRHLLQQLETLAAAEQIALMGSVFSASEDVLAFWQQCGYQVVRVGLTRESTSGAFPVIVVKPVTAEGKTVVKAARQRFEQTFLYGLADTPEPWPVSLVLSAWQQAYFPLQTEWTPSDQQDLEHFVAGHKTYENAAPALYRQTLRWLQQGKVSHCLEEAQQQLLIGKVLQKRSWSDLILQEKYTGQKQARSALRAAIALLFQNSTVE